MSNNGDDFDNVELDGSDLGHHGDGGFNHDHDDDDEPVPPRTAQKASSGSSSNRVVRLAMLGGIIVLIGGGGYAAYSYISNTYLTPAAPRHVAHLPSPAGNGANAHNNVGQPNGFPPANTAPAGFPSADQGAARALPALGGADQNAPEQQNVMAGGHSSEAPGFPDAEAPALKPGEQKAPTVAGPNGVAVPHAQEAGPIGFPAAAPAIPPAPAPAPIEQDSLISTLNSNVVKVLSDKADTNHAATTAAIKAGTDDVKADVDTRATELSSQITALQASTTQLIARVDALAESGVKPDQHKADKADSKAGPHAASGALHHPAAGHRAHVIHPGKPAEPAASSSAQVPEWHLRGFGNGFVVLQKDGRYVPVLIGKPLPDGSGIVEGVGKKDGKSIVRTSTGIIQE